MKRIHRLFTAGLLALSLGAAAQAQQTPIKVGVIFPFRAGPGRRASTSRRPSRPWRRSSTKAAA